METSDRRREEKWDMKWSEKVMRTKKGKRRRRNRSWDQGRKEMKKIERR